MPIYGLNYKDKPDDVQAWLDELGDPYTRTGADISGRVAIDWGVYGVPETFVVDRNGIIAYKQIGPITPKVLEDTILPLVRKLQGGGAWSPVRQRAGISKRAGVPAAAGGALAHE